MYAIMSTGGKQYKVSEGQTIRVEKLPGEVGAPITFDRVLLLSDGETVKVGQPMLSDVTVTGHIVEQGKAKKISVIKFKSKVRYRRNVGHRQPFTKVEILEIKK